LLAVPAILIGLGWCAARTPTEPNIWAMQALTLAYFAVFLVAFPLLARRA